MHAKFDVLHNLPVGGCCGIGGLRGAQRLGRGEGAWAYVGVGKIRSGRRLVEGLGSCGSGSLVVACCGSVCGFRPAFNEGAGAVKGTASMRGHRFGARNLALRVLCRGFGLRGHRRCGVHRVSCNAGGFRFRRLRSGASGLRRLAAVSAIEAPSAPRRHRCRIARRHGTAWRGDSRRISGGTVLPPSRRELERPACR